MALSHELLSQFAKLVNKDKKTNAEATVYGTVIVDSDGNKYVKLDGSDQITPLSNNERPALDSATANAKDGERVSVLIKNHTATVTGNVSSPAARTGDVEELGTQISQFDVVIAHEVTTDDLNAVNARINNLLAITGQFDELSAVTAEIQSLKSKYGEFERLTVEDIEAITAEIDDIEAKTINTGILDTDLLTAFSAEIDKLKAYTADFTYLTALNAEIKRLDVDKLSAKDVDMRYANIDFSNIGEAAIRHLFSDYGLIRDIVVGDGTITGELVGVTIKGDLIEGNTIKADKLVVKGEDGLYYKLNIQAGATTSEAVTKEDLQNGLHGTAIIAKTITADKVNVSDLVAFDATIGGFNITENSVYSGVKSSVSNTTRGVYMDRDGQIAFGDSRNYLRYFKDVDGSYKLAISAGSIVLGSSGKTIEEAVSDISIGARNLIRNSKNLIFEKYYFKPGDPSAVLSIGTLGSMILGQE